MRDVLLLLIGALAAGLVRVVLDLAERITDQRLKRRVAARVFVGEIAVAKAEFKIILEHKEWPDRLDFDPMLDAWKEYRSDFAVGTTAVEWAKVGAFYSNLERTARMIRLGEGCTDADLSVVKEMVTYAENAFPVTARHVAKTERERQEVVEQLG